MSGFTWRQERDSELYFPSPTDFRMVSLSAPGNKLQPGHFTRAVTDAGVKTEESTPHPGKPSEMGLSV